VSSFTNYADARRQTQLVLAEIASDASRIRVAEGDAEDRREICSTPPCSRPGSPEAYCDKL